MGTRRPRGKPEIGGWSIGPEKLDEDAYESVAVGKELGIDVVGDFAEVKIGSGFVERRKTKRRRIVIETMKDQDRR